MAALPVFKLVYLAAKQIAKPLSKSITGFAKNHAGVRRMVVEPVGQAANWVTVRTERILAGKIRAPVRPLSHEDAVVWGGDLMGEFIVYGVAAAFVIKEYQMKNESDRKKAAQLQHQLEDMHLRCDALSTEVLRLQVQVVELQTMHTEDVIRNMEVADKANTKGITSYTMSAITEVASNAGSVARRVFRI